MVPNWTDMFGVLDTTLLTTDVDQDPLNVRTQSQTDIDEEPQVEVGQSETPHLIIPTSTNRVPIDDEKVTKAMEQLRTDPKFDANMEDKVKERCNQELLWWCTSQA